MKCIYCGHKNTRVNNSRGVKNSLAVWRRRECLSCKKVFTTTESAKADNLFIIKSDKRRQRFIYEKLFASIFAILNTRKGRDNGSDSLKAKEIADKVILKMFALSDSKKNVTTAAIIGLVYNELKKIDSAYSDLYIYYSPYRRMIGAKLLTNFNKVVSL